MLNTWLAMALPKKIITVFSVVLTIAALYGLARVTMKPKLDLLYAGLDPAAAGEVIAKLDALDVPYSVKGGAIYTDVARRDSLRMELAREGIPRQSVIGYELFDDVNSFAMTSEMFDTAYWRAKEGELSRTILSMPSIRSARVHFGIEKTSGFARAAAGNSASVTVSTVSGLRPEQAKAIQYITALSVSGLEPDDIAVVDTVKGLVAGPGLEPDSRDYGQGELERATRIKKNLLSLLEARVGMGNARVNVSLELDHNRETQVERTFDPDGRVIKSQTTSELTDTSTGTDGQVTVASNLPEGGGATGTSSSDRSQTNETVNYEISELVRNTEKLPGAVMRMTIAVMINDQITYGDDGVITRTPRPASELEDLEALVRSAAGLKDDRGDSLTLRNLSFEQPPIEDAFEAPGLMDTFLDQYLWSTVQAGLLALVVLILGLFVVRPLLRGTTENEDTRLQPISLNADPQKLADGTPVVAGNLIATPPADPIETMRAMASEQPEDAASLLKSWLEDGTDGEVATT